MPSYPTSVWAPTQKAAGNTIDASHINDAQDEIVAIEGGLRNGTAPLNSSGSTVATLQAGASTFSVRPIEPPPNAVRVQSTIIDLTNNTTLAINWTQQTFAINSSIHSTGTNPQRLTPQTTGVYVVAAMLDLSQALTASTGGLRLQILDSSGGQVGHSGIGGTFPNGVTAMGLKRFDDLTGSTQWVRVEAVMTDASTHSLSTNSWASLYKL